MTPVRHSLYWRGMMPCSLLYSSARILHRALHMKQMTMVYGTPATIDTCEDLNCCELFFVAVVQSARHIIR